MDIYIFIADSLYCTPETNTTLYYKSTVLQYKMFKKKEKINPILSLSMSCCHLGQQRLDHPELGWCQDAEQVSGPTFLGAAWKLGSHYRHVRCSEHCGVGMGHCLATDSGLGAVHQQQV